MKAVSIKPTADVQPTPIAMRTITLLLLLLAGLIAAVTTAPIPSPDAHHGGKEWKERVKCKRMALVHRGDSPRALRFFGKMFRIEMLSLGEA